MLLRELGDELLASVDWKPKCALFAFNTIAADDRNPALPPMLLSSYCSKGKPPYEATSRDAVP